MEEARKALDCHEPPKPYIQTESYPHRALPASPLLFTK